MQRRTGLNEYREDVRWVIVMLFVVIAGADPLVQLFWNSCYRVGWWVRRRVDRFRGQFVDLVTTLGNCYVHVAEATAIRYKRWWKKESR